MKFHILFYALPIVFGYTYNESYVGTADGFRKVPGGVIHESSLHPRSPDYIPSGQISKAISSRPTTAIHTNSDLQKSSQRKISSTATTVATTTTRNLKKRMKLTTTSRTTTRMSSTRKSATTARPTIKPSKTTVKTTTRIYTARPTIIIKSTTTASRPATTSTRIKTTTTMKPSISTAKQSTSTAPTSTMRPSTTTTKQQTTTPKPTSVTPPSTTTASIHNSPAPTDSSGATTTTQSSTLVFSSKRPEAQTITDDDPARFSGRHNASSTNSLTEPTLAAKKSAIAASGFWDYVANYSDSDFDWLSLFGGETTTTTTWNGDTRRLTTVPRNAIDRTAKL